MADDGNEVCSCIILLIILYAIYKAVSWVIEKYGLESIAIVSGIILLIIITIHVCKQVWEEENYLIEKGKALVKFGIVWFVLIFIISVLIELLSAHYHFIDLPKGGGMLFISLFVNMPGTSILLFAGARKLRSCELIENKVIEGRKIIYFGIFWFFFWIISPFILELMSIIDSGSFMTFILVSVPGTITNIAIGRWSSKIDLKKGWEYLNDAQKTLNIEKDSLKRQREDIQNANGQLSQQQADVQKQLKDLQKLKKDISTKKKELEKQQKDIQSARSGLETTWNELEDIMENPFPFILKKKLHKDVFLAEINQLKRTRPGDISSIETDVDKVISDIKKNLNNEIINTEDQYYREAFLEYFKDNGHDITEYDRVRTKYNPTIHTTERRNREWAEKRRFELSKIEKLMDEE